MNYTATLRENGLENDVIFQAFNAYSPATENPPNDLSDNAPLYVNYARQEDFIRLKEKNPSIDLKKILIARYGHNSVAEKVKLAEIYEAKALILFGDPEEVAKVRLVNSKVD